MANLYGYTPREYEAYVKQYGAAPTTQKAGSTTTATEPLPNKVTSTQPLDQGGWINETAKPTTTTQPTSGDVGDGSWIGTKTKTPTTAIAPTTTQKEGLYEDAGTDLMRSATDEYVAGIEGLKGFAGDLKTEELSSIEREFAEKERLLRASEDAFRLANEQRLAAVNASTDAQRAEIEAAYEKQRMAVELQRAETAKAYDEMIKAQELANKRKLVRAETAIGVLGGNFTTAGVADIEETIMQGENAVLSLKMDKDLKDRGLTDTLVNLINDYKTDNLKIEQWKTEQISAAYNDLANQVNAIYADERMAWEDKEKSIRDAAIRYNSTVANYTAQAVQARYDLAQSVISRSDAIKADIEQRNAEGARIANQERDDARMALQNLMTTLPAETFTSLTPAQAGQLRMLEEKAGYPQGLLELGMKTFKEMAHDQKTIYQNASIEIKQQMADIKTKMGDKVSFQTDSNGNVTVVTYDPYTGVTSTIPVGQIGAGKPYKITTDSFGNTTIVPQYPGQNVPGGAGTKDVSPRGTQIPVVKNQDGTVTINVPDGATGGQCGRFVNNYLASAGANGISMGDSFESKTTWINSKTPHPGDVFVMPYSWTGHTGIVERVSADGQTIYVADSNWGNDEKVQHHALPVSKITGFITTPNSIFDVPSWMGASLAAGDANYGEPKAAAAPTPAPPPQTVQQFYEAYRTATGKDPSAKALDLFKSDPEAAMRVLEADKSRADEPSLIDQLIKLRDY
jgi:hypothetical protein